MVLNQKVKVAILDLYEGEPNEGMRGIRQQIEAFGADNQIALSCDIFDVRLKNEMPDLDYDIYISTGGPGNPLESAGMGWEKKFFDLIERIKAYNEDYPKEKKHLLLICHSFQLYCRQYEYGKVSKRKSTSFGVMTVHKNADALNEPLLKHLDDPFWVVDSRDYQITKPNKKKLRPGAVLCIEKYRPHVFLERAVMGIRFDDAIVGFQFHPEADAAGIRMYLMREDKKNYVIKRYGKAKYLQMLSRLEEPDKIASTYHTIIPRFLKIGLQAHLTQAVV